MIYPIRIVIYACLILLFPFKGAGQISDSTFVIGTVDGNNVFFSDMLSEYMKSSDSEPTLEQLRSFLPLYLNYKAKLTYGMNNGYSNDSLIVDEYNEFVRQAAYSYLMNNVVKPGLFQEFQERSKWELKVFHLLIDPKDIEDQNDIESVDIRLKKARQDLENGLPLDEVNRKYSSIQQGRTMGGSLPWITAGQTLKAFEDIVFRLDIGEISESFRTQYGYHIAVLIEKRPRSAARLVSHIFTRRRPVNEHNDNINKAYLALADSNISWSDAVQKYSEDPVSVSSDGKIGWIDYTTSLPENFVDKIMNLNPELPYSEPIETQFGYHIFKIDSVRSFESDDKRLEHLSEQFDNTSYFQQDKAFILEEANKAFPDHHFTDSTVADMTETLFPEFKTISRSYLNGLVVYKINEDILWSANASDSNEVKKIYDRNSDEYVIKPRPFYYQFTSRDSSTISSVKQFIETGGDPDAVAEHFDQVSIKIDSTSLYDSIPLFDLRSQKPETLSSIRSQNGTFSVILLVKHLNERKMLFEEAFDSIFNTYLPTKETNWMSELRQLYNVSYNYTNLQQAYQSYYN